MGTFPDGFFDTLHGHFRCAGFFHLEPFPAEHNKARSKYEEKKKDFFETMKLPDCEIRKDFDDNVFHDKTPFCREKFLHAPLYQPFVVFTRRGPFPMI